MKTNKEKTAFEVTKENNLNTAKKYIESAQKRGDREKEKIACRLWARIFSSNEKDLI